LELFSFLMIFVLALINFFNLLFSFRCSSDFSGVPVRIFDETFFPALFGVLFCLICKGEISCIVTLVVETACSFTFSG